MKNSAQAAVRVAARVLIESYAKSQARGFVLEGPLLGSTLSQEQKEALHDFRKRVLCSKNAHLASDYQIELEKRYQIDERSFHFIATKNGKVRAAIRLTPRPFESEALLENRAEIQIQIKENSIEFNRLQVEMGDDSKGLGRALMLLAGCRAYYDLGVHNFYAICRGKTVEKFFKFGFEIQSNAHFALESRPGSEYAVITGNATRVAMHLLNNPSLVLPKIHIPSERLGALWQSFRQNYLKQRASKSLSAERV